MYTMASTTFRVCDIYATISYGLSIWLFKLYMYSKNSESRLKPMRKSLVYSA